MKIAFFGGSNVSGGGFPDGRDDCWIYPNLIKNSGHQIHNGGIDGGNAEEIFFSAQKYLISNDCDLVVVEWNNYTRLRYRPAPNIEISISSRAINVPKSVFLPPFGQQDLEQFQKILLMMEHDYHKILDIIDYCVILSWICEKNGTKLIMIDDIFWSPDMFDDHKDLNNLTEKTKNLLDFDLRSDQDIRDLLLVLKKSFSRLDSSQWLNLFRRLQDQALDLADDKVHFGPKTHRYLAEMIMDKMK